MRTLRDYTSKACGEDLRIGVGIHSDQVICGTTGPGIAKRMTAIGDNVKVSRNV